MNPEILQQLYTIFREESREHLTSLQQLLGEMSDTAVSVERLHQGMRIAHTLKGAAAMVGADAIVTLAHEIEDRFLEWTTDPMLFDAKAARQGVDVLSQLVENVTFGTGEIAAPASSGGEECILTDHSSAEERPRSDDTEHAANTLPLATSGPERTTNSDTVRVPIARLEDVHGNLEDLALVRFAVTSLIERERSVREQVRSFLLSERLERNAQGKALLQAVDALEWPEQNTTLSLERATTQIQQSVRKLRLVPWGTLRYALERTVRDTASLLDKEVSLQLEAPDDEIDKRVLDIVRDPLIHVLRNAVDHGIETKDVRRAQGKPACGRVRLSVSFDDRGVTFLVEDDGCGINLERLRQVVAMAVPGRELSDTELLDQLFESGRSTAQEISPISGRGVGLDLARRNLQAANGRITVLSRGVLGGATFRLWVPVDLTLGPALLVRADAKYFAIGLEHTERVFRLPSTRIDVTSGRLLLHLDDGDPLPLLRLDDLLGTATQPLVQEVTVVMLKDAHCRLPLLVDAIVDSRELLVVPLPWNLDGLPLLRGGSILPDNSVALVLDVPALLRLHRHGTRASLVPAPTTRMRRVLVADDSHTARALAKSALLSAGYDVELAVDGLDAWNRLQQLEFALLVTDVQMPNVDGFELTQRVRADSRLNKLPVIIVTTRSTREDIERGLSLGADEFVVKGPLQREKLIEAVGRHA